MFDFEDRQKVDEVKYESATYADVIVADTECLVSEYSLLHPFAADMVNDADKELLSASFVNAYDLDTEGLKETFKDFWKWVKKVWAKFVTAMANLYKKIKGFLGFKEKEINTELKDITPEKQFEYLITYSEPKVDSGNSDNDLSKAIKYLEKVDADANQAIEDAKKYLVDRQKKNTVHFNIDEKLLFKVGKVIPREDIRDLTEMLKGITYADEIQAVVSCETVMNADFFHRKVVSITFLTLGGMKTYKVPTNINITTTVYGKGSTDYKEYLNGNLTVIDNNKKLIVEADKLAKETEKLIKELDGSDKTEDKDKVKTAQTHVAALKKQVTETTKVVNKTIVVKNKRTKNKNFKHKKKKK